MMFSEYAVLVVPKVQCDRLLVAWVLNGTSSFWKGVRYFNFKFAIGGSSSSTVVVDHNAIKLLNDIEEVLLVL